MTSKPSVLFVCVHNAGRSQMAAGWLRHLAGDSVEVRSAGSAPADQINPVAVRAMAEVGVDITAEQPKKLDDTAARDSDVIITMGCGDACPVFPGKRYEDWQLTDPAGRGIDVVRTVRDDIRVRVEKLLTELAGLPWLPAREQPCGPRKTPRATSILWSICCSAIEPRPPAALVSVGQLPMSAGPWQPRSEMLTGRPHAGDLLKAVKKTHRVSERVAGAPRHFLQRERVSVRIDDLGVLDPAADIRDLSDLDAAPEELGPGLLDVRDHQMYTLDGAGFHDVEHR